MTWAVIYLGRSAGDDMSSWLYLEVPGYAVKSRYVTVDGDLIAGGLGTFEIIFGGHTIAITYFPSLF